MCSSWFVIIILLILFYFLNSIFLRSEKKIKGKFTCFEKVICFFLSLKGVLGRMILLIVLPEWGLRLLSQHIGRNGEKYGKGENVSSFWAVFVCLVTPHALTHKVDVECSSMQGNMGFGGETGKGPARVGERLGVLRDDVIRDDEEVGDDNLEGSGTIPHVGTMGMDGTDNFTFETHVLHIPRNKRRYILMEQLCMKSRAD